MTVVGAMSGPLFFVYPSQFLDFKEVGRAGRGLEAGRPLLPLLQVSTPESGASKLFTRIEIENLAEQRIAYRVRTNSKDSYSVHHNPGFVERGRRGEVLVYLKPGQTLSAQHRFMVTAAEVPEGGCYRMIIARFKKSLVLSTVEVVTIQVRC